MKTIISIFLSFALIFAIGYFASKANSLGVRYQKLPCHLGLLNVAELQEKPIKYAFFGSSRSFEAINAFLIQEELSSVGEGVYNGAVYDMSKSWRGNGINYVILKDLLSKQSVEKVYVEANLSNHLIYHSYWIDVANYRYIAGDLFSRKDINFLKRLTLMFKHLGKKVSSDITTLILGTAVGGSAKGKYYDCSAAAGRGRERPDLRLQRKNKYYGNEKGFFEWNIDSDFEARADFYLKKMSELSKDRGFELIFTHFNVSYSPPLSKEFVDRFETKYGHRLISIQNRNTIESIYLDGYRDITHMNDVGQRKYAHWFSNEMKNWEFKEK